MKDPLQLIGIRRKCFIERRKMGREAHEGYTPPNSMLSGHPTFDTAFYNFLNVVTYVRGIVVIKCFCMWPIKYVV